MTLMKIVFNIIYKNLAFLLANNTQGYPQGGTDLKNDKF